MDGCIKIGLEILWILLKECIRFREILITYIDGIENGIEEKYISIICFIYIFIIYL